MNEKAKWVILISILLIIFSHSESLFSFDKKLRVIAERADVYLNPDMNSPVIETLEKGDILILSSDRKFRKIFDYVYYTSKNTGSTKSGYILDSSVEKLFQSTKVITIKNEEKNKEKAAKPAVNFRNTNWGMSKEQVIELEGEPHRQEKSRGLDIIEYKKNVMDNDCLIGYVFAKDRLTAAKYIFLEQQKEKNQYIRDYEKIKDLLIKKYGMPEEDNALWRNNLYKNNPSKWGYAVGSGHLEYFSLWGTPETEISLKLSGKNSEILLKVEYIGISLKDLMKREEEKALLALYSVLSQQ